LQWWGEKCVLIGCLDGKLLDWRLGEEVKEVYQLEGSVIIMRWSLSRRLLAVGSSKGVLTLYGVKSVSGSCAALERVMSFTAHPPQRSNEDMRFGQLNKQAEIWSLCWSPNDSRVATCSEDQTTKIWNTTQWTCETTLHGHTMAVTSVDWREETGDRSVLATCSDDRTVRVMDGTTFEIIHIFSTHDLYGWHTLTYLALHPSALSSVNRLLLTCTTQNGYVVVWDVWSGGRVACGRIHCGSVEGLAWNRSTGTLATVGADCVVHLFELHLPCS
jgi:WD40 repeat protein